MHGGRFLDMSMIIFTILMIGYFKFLFATPTADIEKDRVSFNCINVPITYEQEGFIVVAKCGMGFVQNKDVGVTILELHGLGPVLFSRNTRCSAGNAFEAC